MVSLFCFTALTPLGAEQKFSNAKTFEEEDLYILEALSAKNSLDFTTAGELFAKLYAESGKKEYLYELLEADLFLNRYKSVLAKIESLPSHLRKDVRLTRYEILSLYELERLEEAKSLALALSKKTQEREEYLLAADVLLKMRLYDEALLLLEEAYAKAYDEKIVEKIANILYTNLNRQRDAIERLESHTRIHGITTPLGMRLLSFYGVQNNIEGLLSTYLRLYNLESDEKIAQKIIQIYSYKRDYLSLMAFLEESGSDDAMLLELYSSMKSNEKAQKLAMRLYEERGDVIYLGQSAIYMYINAKDKNDKLLLDDVVGKLKQVVEVKRDPIYLNYLGYLLIDHEIDIREGMRYIEQVLEESPNSAYYLDSLAWGYYKLGECKKAHDIITEVQKLPGGEHEEVQGHVKEIDACLKNLQKGKKI